MTKLVSTRQQLEAQLNENKVVQEVNPALSNNCCLQCQPKIVSGSEINGVAYILSITGMSAVLL